MADKALKEDDYKMAEAPNEQRIHERFRVNMKAYIRLSDGSVTQAQAVDISMGGIYIEYGAPADEGKIFELAFDLAFADDFKRIRVKAEVVRCVMIGSRSLFGLAFVFTEFAKEADELLEKYMELRKTRVM
jgi:PilZ domain-containing protein